MKVISWYYDYYENLFIDNDTGEPVFDIFRVISPSRLLILDNQLGYDYNHTEYIHDVTPGVVYEIVWEVPLEMDLEYE